jgi:hypothetical protein
VRQFIALWTELPDSNKKEKKKEKKKQLVLRFGSNKTLHAGEMYYFLSE